jgi:tetratricopeptide (TPR) repeat protein
MSAAKKPARPRQKIRPGREEREDAPPESGRWNALILALILVLTAAVFSNSLRNEFIDELDDDIYVVNNAAVKDLSAAGLKTIFTTFVAGNYHPLTMLSYAVEYRLFGLNPRAYHRTNRLLHGLNTALVFALVWLLWRRRAAAVLAALLFAVHPMRVESVSWISERKDVLFALFYLAALLAYVSYVKDRAKRGRLAGTLILFLLSLLSKPTAVTLPVVLLLIDVYLRRKLDRRAWLEKIPFFVLAVVFGALTLATQDPGTTLQEMTGRYGFFDRLFFPFYALAFYLVRLFVPTGLSAYHYYPELVGGRLPWEYHAAPVVVIIVILAVVLARGRFRREVVFGSLFFLVTVAVTLQVIPAGRAVAAERYTYIPYLGPFLVLGFLFDHALKRGKGAGRWLRPVALAAAILIVLGLSYGTYRRNETWRDSLTVFSDVIAKNPEAGHGYFLRGLIHYKKRDYGAALADYDRAVDLGFRDAKLFNNRAIVRGMNKDYRGALADLELALELNPQFVEALSNRGNVKAALGDQDGAIQDFEQALRLSPSYINAHYGLGMVSYARGDMKAACAHWQRAAQLGSEQARKLIAERCK